jgi:hypothetical protein
MQSPGDAPGPETIAKQQCRRLAAALVKRDQATPRLCGRHIVIHVNVTFLDHAEILGCGWRNGNDHGRNLPPPRQELPAILAGEVSPYSRPFYQIIDLIVIFLISRLVRRLQPVCTKPVHRRPQR